MAAEPVEGGLMPDRLSRTDKRIAPAKPLESSKVGVCRVHFSAVLNSNGGKVSVRGEIARGSGRRQEIAQQLKVARSRLDDCYRGLRQPKCNNIQSLFDGERFGTTAERVVSRMKPSSTFQTSPTGSVPERTSSSQALALA